MKTHRTCDECLNSEPNDKEEFSLLCKKTGIAVCKDDCCEDFVPKEQCEIIADRLEAAAKKAAASGKRKDLQEYLRLRKELLQ